MILTLCEANYLCGKQQVTGQSATVSVTYIYIISAPSDNIGVLTELNKLNSFSIEASHIFFGLSKRKKKKEIPHEQNTAHQGDNKL